jgi:large subunit ribosomal protein L5
MSARLQKIYKEQIRNSLQEKMNYKSAMEVPYITKITINVGLGQAVKDKKVIEHAVGDIEKISGQKPIVTKAKNQ